MNSFHLRSAHWIGFVALAAGCSSASSTQAPAGDEARAPTAAPAPVKSLEVEAWRRLMARTPHPHEGCFQAAHPSTDWVEVPCVEAPHVPYRPRVGIEGQTAGGGGGDVSPQVSGTTITWAEGSFPQASVGSSNGSYSLQLNTNTLSNAMNMVPLCSGAANPSQCLGWQQFVYGAEQVGGSNVVFIQYWLLDYKNPCPSGWTSSGNDCFANSAGAASIPDQPLSNLANLRLTGTAGSSDSVTMSVGTGTLYSVSQASVLNLSQQWSTAEFNVFGNGNGAEVSFNPGSTVVVHTLTSSASGTRHQPSDSGQSFTGETNNLTVVPGSVCLFGGDHPGIQFMESYQAEATPPVCPELAPTPNPVPVPAGAFGSSNINIVGNLVGQSSNTALLPGTCWVTPSGGFSANPHPANLFQGIGPEIDYSIPATTPVGSTYHAAVTCDNGQSTQQNISVTSPLLTASPNPLRVLAGGCAGAKSFYSIASLGWQGASPCSSPTYTVVPSTVPPGITAYATASGLVEVCDKTGVLQSFELQITSSCNVSTELQVDVTSCIPQTACANSCSATTPDGCGGYIDCSGSCPGDSKCTAPEGSTAGLLCCGPGKYIPAGGTSCVCSPGTTWDPSLDKCVPTSQKCTAPKVWCSCANMCVLPKLCTPGC